MITLHSYCQHSGLKVSGPGKVSNAVMLHIQPIDNAGLFSKPTAAAGLNLSDVASEITSQLIPGESYTITIEKTPAPIPTS